MKFLSLFAGIEGFGLGLARAGHECVGQVECDRDCNRVLRRHFPDVPRFEDVRDFDGSGLAVRPGLICGGFPCQDLSLAGQRAGLAGKRSGLWFEFKRIIAALAPAVVLVENVVGLFSSRAGADFAVILRGLDELGYGVAWRVLDAQWHGLAQQRKRVFLVGCLGDVRRAAEILFERESLPWDPPPRRQTRAHVAAPLEARAGSGFPGTDACAGHVVGAFNWRGGDKQSDLGWDEEKSGCLHSRQTPAIAKCLNAGRDGYNDGSDQNYVVEEPFAFQPRIARNGRGQPTDLVPAISASETGPHGDSKPHVCYDVAYSVNGNGSKFGSGRGNQDTFIPSETAVRRLTPRECERLQGFPDDWTRWGDDGKELSDSARYRMLGNAVAVPVAEWIGRRIAP